MKWIGQDIYDFIARFRNDVYLEDLTNPGGGTLKHLVLDTNNKIRFRTSAEVLSDIGATGDITSVTITTDSGAGNRHAVDSGAANFSFLGSNGVDVTNSTNTVTVQAVPGEIDHDSLLNFVAAEHYDWSSDISSTATINAANIPTLNQSTTGQAGTVAVSANTTNSDFPVVFHDSNTLHDDGASDFTYNPSTNNLKIGKLTANSSGSTLAGIVSVGTTDGDDRLHIARYRDATTIYPFAHIYAGLDGLNSKCGFKIVVRNNSGVLRDALVIDGHTQEATFANGGIVNCTKLNTGQGDNELYAMNQDVETTDNVTFASVSTPTLVGAVNMPSGNLTIDNHAVVSKTLTVGGAGTTPAVSIRTVKVTLSTADCNTLHTTPVTVVHAAGADTVIVPVSGMIRVDRAATQTNSSADLNFHYDGTSGGFLNSSLVHLRRFMWNETGDRVFNLAPQAIERSQSLTEDVNKDLVVSVDSALTNNCITSATIFLTYHVFDIS